ncbi:MAG: gamma-glutamyl-gamma-aminobutyrate hydrolase family protein [Pseudomonadota bacterium]
MARYRPKIGVSVSSRTGWRVFPFFWWAIWRAGGRAVKIHTVNRRNNLQGLDGVVIGGGDDISVDLYDGRLKPDVKFDLARDELELRLIAEAEARHLPILGVCRGAQLINVTRGGSLHVDIYESYPDAKKYWTPLPRKRIRIAEASRLSDVIGTEPSEVNSLHTQSVDRLGREMAAVAWDEAGVVQAVECRGGPRYVIGVQWHPEYLVFSRRDWQLFRVLVENAASPKVMAKTETEAELGEQPTPALRTGT